ncbi:MAG: alanine--glyoxylate aminotransferase family protein [Ectobacillus sp.]
MREMGRILMGPGPGDVHPRVLRAMSTPLLGHLDPAFLQIMNEMMDSLRYVFETKNELTLAMSGTGSAGMETVFVNLIEPGDKVIIGVNGVFGTRMADVAARAGAEVLEVKGKWGGIIEPDDVEQVLKQHGDIKLIALVHAETSTGVLQPLKEIGEMARKYEALFVCDMVTSLGGVHVKTDEYKVDAAYSGTQKCLSAPPGLSPVTFSERAAAVLAKRKSKVQSWYLDLSMIQNYWGEERFYHHTAPISMIYALKEALLLIEEEGLDNVTERHRLYGAALQAGLEAMGLELLVGEKHRLPQLTSVKVPDGVNDAAFRARLLEKYGLEIGGGLGELKGKIWRIGLMGYNAKQVNVTLLLSAFEDVLSELGVPIAKGEALQAMRRYVRSCC